MYPQWARRSLPSLPLEEHNEFVEKAVRIVDKNSKRVKINTDGTAGLVTQTQVALVHIPSIDIDVKKRSRLLQDVSTRTAGGMFKDLYLCVGLKVVVTDNLWTQMGLVNGTTGTVVGIYFDSKIGPIEGKSVKMVLVELDSMYTGPSFVGGAGKRVVPIVRVTREFRVGKTRCERTQFPLQPAMAITIHKSQGLTVGPSERVTLLILDIGDKDWSAGLAYVGLSRAQMLSGIALEPVRGYEES